MKELSKLQLAWSHRKAGNGKTLRDYLDFVIDGQPLSQILDVTEYDLISCLGWLSAEGNSQAVGRLMLEQAPDFPNNRRSLYICPECGDLGCGAVSAVIEESERYIVWHGFGYENNYEEMIHSLERYRIVGPYKFEKDAYRTAIQSALR